MRPAISVENQSRHTPFLCSGYLEVGGALEAVQATMDAPKAFWQQGLGLSARESLQQNWGRIQAEAQEQYSLTLKRPTARTRAASTGGKLVRLVVVSRHGKIGRSRPRARDKQVIQAIQDELAAMMAAIGDVPLGQLAEGLQEASELQEKLALVRSWLDIVEAGVRHPRKAPSPTVTKSVVLERLDGYVHQIEGGTAFVTLKSQHGDELTGEYAADELAASGITEGRRFGCETVEVDGAVRVLFEAVPDEPVTEDEEDAISGRIGELFQDDELDGDY